MYIKKSHLIILHLFRKDVFMSKTIRQIALHIRKDYPTIYNAIKELVKENILIIKKVGKASVCEFSFSQKSLSLISFLDEQETFSKKIKNTDVLLDFKEFLDDILLVTGSYAKGKETRASDLDVVLITKDQAFHKQKLLETVTSLMVPRVHALVLTHNDFIKMLLDKQQNFGKEIYVNNLIYRNALRYYELIKEARERGFRG